MHGLGPFGKLEISKYHIGHHSQTSLGQTLLGPHDADELTFNLREQIILFSSGLVIGTLLWLLLGRRFDYSLVLITLIIVCILHFWIWASFHMSFHNVHHRTNEEIKNKDGRSVYLFGVLEHQNTRQQCRGNSSFWCNFYRYLAWYHALHHLNKGKKANYNIVIPGADFALGTYKDHVDNREYFAGKCPEGPQEEWLSKHLFFEVKVDSDNVFLYREHHSQPWQPLPLKF
jgi:hypothetical protein